MLRPLRWLVFAAVVVCCLPASRAETVASLPEPTGYVNDFAGVLSAETRQSLEALCAQVDQKAHAQIAVVTLKSVDADKDGTTPTIEEFATALEDKWKVGAKGTDKGVLMIFVASPPPMHGRIEVGYGLEGILNDAKVGDIGRAMKPMLRSGDYDQGISLGVETVAQDIAADAGVTLAGEPARQAPVYRTAPQQAQITSGEGMVAGAILIAVIAVLIFTGNIGWLFFILFNLLGGGGGGRGGGGFGGDGGGGFGGGGDDGGGFGGFGGGSSGGGGADF